KPSSGCGACETKRTSNTSRSDAGERNMGASVNAVDPSLEAPGKTSRPRPAVIPRIALTSGEPAGIGPELCLALAAKELPCDLVCFADRALLEERAHSLGIAARLRTYEPAVGQTRIAHRTGELAVAHLPLAASSVAGRPDPANARYVLALLDRAVDGTLAGEFDALVTAPVHKGIINDAGIAFTGHTEYPQHRPKTARAATVLTSGAL